ncbi:MAG: SAF domain-containing protein, partial [Gammaproteobacteria bacterium]
MKSLLSRGLALLRNRTLILLLIAGAFGALAVSGARGYIADRLAVERERLNPRLAMVDVVVAKRDLAPGAPVDPDTMAVRSLPAEYVSGAAIRPDVFEHHSGARLAHAMRSGEPLLPGALEQGRDRGDEGDRHDRAPRGVAGHGEGAGAHRCADDER